MKVAMGFDAINGCPVFMLHYAGFWLGTFVKALSSSGYLPFKRGNNES
jgi:hypothetical protein